MVRERAYGAQRSGSALAFLARPNLAPLTLVQLYVKLFRRGADMCPGLVPFAVRHSLDLIEARDGTACVACVL